MKGLPEAGKDGGWPLVMIDFVACLVVNLDRFAGHGSRQDCVDGSGLLGWQRGRNFTAFATVSSVARAFPLLILTTPKYNCVFR